MSPAPRKPTGYVIVGDGASLPAINSLLRFVGDAPAHVFLEAGYDRKAVGDKDLPVASSADLSWVDRKKSGKTVRAAAFDARTTRSIARVLREDFGIPRQSIKAQAYWVA